MKDRGPIWDQAERAPAYRDMRDRVDRLARHVRKDPEAPVNTTFSDWRDG